MRSAKELRELCHSLEDVLTETLQVAGHAMPLQLRARLSFLTGCAVGAIWTALPTLEEKEPPPEPPV